MRQVAIDNVYTYMVHLAFSGICSQPDRDRRCRIRIRYSVVVVSNGNICTYFGHRQIAATAAAHITLYTCRMVSHFVCTNDVGDLTRMERVCNRDQMKLKCCVLFHLQPPHDVRPHSLLWRANHCNKCKLLIKQRRVRERQIFTLFWNDGCVFSSFLFL